MTQPNDAGRRTRVSRPYPTYTLEDALSVARAIYEVNAGLPFARELLAGALGTTPKSSAFTMRLNASAAYGLTEGGYNDPDIRLTALGEAAVASGRDAEGKLAIVQAATNPETFAGFYALYDGRKLPQSAYLHNILQRELGVPPQLAEECLDILLSNGEFAGLITESDGQHLVEMPNQEESAAVASAEGAAISEETATSYAPRQPEDGAFRDDDSSARDQGQPKRIFIGHVGDSDAASYIAGMLDEFGISSVGSRIPDDDGGLLLPRESSSAMRDSNAAVIVFQSPNHSGPSRDRMIGLLGAASVLFDDRVVVVCEDGEPTSVSLDGLARIDFDGDRPGASGLKLLGALHKVGVIRVSA